MIVGLGIDIIEIKKLHDALDRIGNRLKNRTFLSGKAYSIATKLGATKFWISLSHSDQYAVAWVILES